MIVRVFIDRSSKSMDYGLLAKQEQHRTQNTEHQTPNFKLRTLDISFIIIAYRPNIDSAISSVINQQGNFSRELIITDASLDSCLEQKISSIRENFPIKYVKIPGEQFASCANKAISLCKSRFVLCMNDDVVLFSDFVIQALKGFKIDNMIWAVCGVLVNKGTAIDSLGQKIKFSGRVVEIAHGVPLNKVSLKNGFVFGVPGACAIYKKQALDTLKQGQGYLCDKFGAFYEDADLNWRANRKGLLAYRIKDAVALHTRGASYRSSKFGVLSSELVGRDRKCFRICLLPPKQRFILFRNRFYMITRNVGLLGFILRLPFIFFWFVSVLVCSNFCAKNICIFNQTPINR